MIKMYLSHFEFNSDIKRHKCFYTKVPKLLEVLQKNSIEIIYLKEFQGYDKIEKTISECDCLLAIVDDNWISSTWKATEVTYANGDCGSGFTNNLRIPAKPVFIFPIHENVNLAFLRNYPGPITLPSDVNKSLEIITKRLNIRH